MTTPQGTWSTPAPEGPDSATGAEPRDRVPPASTADLPGGPNDRAGRSTGKTLAVITGGLAAVSVVAAGLLWGGGQLLGALEPEELSEEQLASLLLEPEDFAPDWQEVEPVADEDLVAEHEEAFDEVLGDAVCDGRRAEGALAVSPDGTLAGWSTAEELCASPSRALEDTRASAELLLELRAREVQERAAASGAVVADFTGGEFEVDLGDDVYAYETHVEFRLGLETFSEHTVEMLVFSDEGTASAGIQAWGRSVPTTVRQRALEGLRDNLDRLDEQR